MLETIMKIILIPISVILFHLGIIIGFFFRNSYPHRMNNYDSVKKYGYLHCLRSMFKDTYGQLEYELKDRIS